MFLEKEKAPEAGALGVSVLVWLGARPMQRPMEGLVRHIVGVALVALAVAGCSTTGTREANEAVAAKYVGQPVDAFFLEHGPPHDEHQLNSGDTMYLWAENALVPRGIYGLQPVSANGPTSTDRVVVQCELQIVASRSGTIQRISVHNDTIGEWQLSRCREKFV